MFLLLVQIYKTQTTENMKIKSEMIHLKFSVTNNLLSNKICIPDIYKLCCLLCTQQLVADKNMLS